MKTQMTITTDGGNTFSVTSESGNTYTVTVRYPVHGNEDIRTFACTCPAGVRGKSCKHATAVIDYIDDMDNVNDDVYDDDNEY